jgi:uncharacterized repeat protein (TIGR01451 family)
MVRGKRSEGVRRGATSLFALLFLFALVIGQSGLSANAAGPSLTMGIASGPNAPDNGVLDSGAIQLDFIAAGPFTYDHSTGVGGAFKDRTISKNNGVVESLEGGDFACGDKVVFFTAITVGAGAGSGSVNLTYTYDGETTSGAPVGFDDILSASVNSPDSGNKNLSGNESASIQSEQFITSGKDRLETTIRVDGVDGGEQIILRMVVELYCAPNPGKVTGNIQSTLDDALVVNGGKINVGEQTVPLKQAGDILLPGLNVQKSCPAAATVGDTITYHITVSNTGQDTLVDLVVNDPLLGGDLAGFGSSLAAGASVSKDFTYVLGSDPDPLTNTVTATATGRSSNASVNDSADCTTDVLFPDLGIEKVADSATVDAGDQVGYTITVTNNGDGTAEGVVMKDTLPTNEGLSWSFNQVGGGWSCAIDAGVLTCGGPNFDLGAGASASVHLSSPTKAATCGQILNVATVKAGNNQDVESEQIAIVVQCASLSVTKVADASHVDAGDDIGYTITVTNSGEGTAKGVALTDDLPAGSGLAWAIDGGSGAGDCDIENDMLTCDFGEIAGGASKTVHISSPTTPASCGLVSNSVDVTSANDGSPSAGPVTITVDCPDVSVLKTADQGTIDAGDTAAFTIVVENHGDGVARDVTLTDTLPEGVSWSQDSASCDIEDGVLTCDFGDLAPGASRTVHVSGKTDAQDCGELVNTATVSSSNEGKTDEVDNSSQATITVDCPDIDIDKTADARLVDAAETIGFTITVTNHGPGAAKDVVMTDTLPTNEGLSWSIDAIDGHAPGAEPMCSITDGVLECDFGRMGAEEEHSVHITSDTDATTCGVVDNTAVVTTSNGGGDEDDASLVVNCPDLGIQITKGGPDLAHVGDTVDYTFDVQLTTPEPLFDVVVSDAMCDEGAPVYVSGDDGDQVLEPGEVWSYTCTHLVTETDADPLPNTATVEGTADDGRSTSDQDSHEVDLIHPAIRIIKRVDPRSGEPGDTVTYSYEVINRGDTTLFDISVDDDVIGHIGDIAELEPGARVTLTKDWVLPSDEISVTNVGTATGTDVLGTTVSDDNDASVTIVEPSTPTPPPTAFTGSDVAGFGLLAAALFALGLLALAVTRRRQPAA